MAHEYYFSVDTDDDQGVPFGPVNKDNMDVSRLLIDMTCWLDINESITHIEHMLITANPVTTPANTWQADYPLSDTSNGASMPDTYPLGFVSTSVIHEGKMIAMDLGAGTPGFSYGVSFTATAGVSRRRRVVDVLVAIDQPLNSMMVGLATTPPSYFYPLIINASTLLPYQFAGMVYIRNAVNAPISITLPPSPAVGTVISFLDAGATGKLYPVTFFGDSSSPVFSSTQEYTSGSYVANTYGFQVDFQWTGSSWYTDGPYMPLAGGSISGSLDAQWYNLGGVTFANYDTAYHYIYNRTGAMTMLLGDSNLYRAAGHYMQSAAGESFAIFSNGGSFNQSGSWAVISDDSLKQDIVPYTTGLAAVLALNPVSFKYITITPTRPLDETNYGLMASEVQPILPEMVRSVDLNLDGVPDPIQTLSPTHLVYVLVNAVKDLNAEIDAVNARVDAALQGVTNATEAPAGRIGEYLVASNSVGVALSSDVPTQISTITISAGDWEIWGSADFLPPGSISPNVIVSSISIHPNALPTEADMLTGVGIINMITTNSLTSGQQQVMMTGQCRSNSSVSLDLYLVAQTSFSGGSTVLTKGYICARRVR